VITEEDLKEMTDSVVHKYEGILEKAKQIASEVKPKKTSLPAPVAEEDGSAVIQTGADAHVLKQVSEKISIVRRRFTSIRRWSVNSPAEQRWERVKFDGLGIR
jgi:hypothetical protein